MSPKQIKSYIWLPMLMLLFIGFMADMAGASIGGKDQPLPVENDLLQFKAGSHIMGFKPDKVYLVNTAGFFSVEFLGARTVAPQATTAGDGQSKNDVAVTSPATPLTPGSGNTLAKLQRVEYPGLWDGITLRYDAAKDGLAESTYFIQPGADVADIRLRYNTDTELQEDGSLKIKLPSQQGYITESRPVAWQVLDGIRQPVQVAYEIKDGTIGFKTGEYNKDQELIIDPTYQWHSFYGSILNDSGAAITVDGSGNIYVTGYSYATWGSPLHAHSSGTNYDIVVMKLNNSGELLWHTFYGSASSDGGYAITVDGGGNIYVTGCSDVNGDVSWGSPLHAPSSGGLENIVVMKLDSSGTLLWNTFYGSLDSGEGIAIDTSGNVYITGFSDATWGSPLHAHSSGANSDIVVMKLDNSGEFLWNTFYGSASHDRGNGIAVDGSSNVYITGESYADWGNPLHVHSSGTNYDIVVIKLDGSGELLWNTFYGSINNDNGHSSAVDNSGNVFITGCSNATWGNPLHAHSGGVNNDIVVMKLDSSGALAWNTFYGSYFDNGSSIAVDRGDNIYITGASNATWGSPQHAHSGGVNSDIMVMKLDSSGALVWNTFYGSASHDYGSVIAVDGSGNIYVTGQSAAWGSPLHVYSGDADIVVFKFKEDFPAPIPVPVIRSKFLPAINLLLLGK